MSSIVALIIGIVLLLIMIMRTKISAFPALVVTSILVGLLSGLSPADTMKAVTDGFGNTLGSIGIVIGFGCIMGKFLEKSGAAKKMAITILRIFGIDKSDVVLGICGLLVSIPVFCDSGFVILSELAKEFSRLTNKSMVGLGGILGMGLYITHFLVPPTPGPLAVAQFFEVDLGMMIISGIALSIPLFILSIFYFRKMEKKFPKLIPDQSFDSLNGEKQVIIREIKRGDEEILEVENEDCLPGTFISFAPVVIPVLLILINTIAKALDVQGTLRNIIVVLGDPIVAIFSGVILGIYGLCSHLDKKEALKIIEQAMADAGLIILVTGAGGALGNVIRVTNIGDFIAKSIINLNIPVILVPLLLGALLRIPQGSGTVAMITGGSILGPMLPSLGLNPILAALALCNTSMFISYPNDSYFWVVTNFSGMDVETSLKSWSLSTALIPIAGSIILIIASFFV